MTPGVTYEVTPGMTYGDDVRRCRVGTAVGGGVRECRPEAPLDSPQ